MTDGNQEWQKLMRSSERLAWIGVVVLTMATAAQFWHGSVSAVMGTMVGLGLTITSAIILRRKRKQG